MYSKAFTVLAAFSLMALAACNGQKGHSNVSIKTTADSVAYAIGASIGGNMKNDGLDSLNLDILKQGMYAALHGDSLLVSQASTQSLIQSYLQEKKMAKGKAAIEEGKKFLAENKSKPGVIELPDGLQYQVIKEGTGPIPTIEDTVIVHYHGTLIDGTFFDGTDGKEPTTHPVSQFIQGWTEALTMMKVGSKWKVFVPANLAYGDRPMGPKIGPNSTLIFDLELLGIKGK